MKSTTFSVVFALVIAVASADVIPACIQTCGVKYIGSTGCDLADIKCICSSDVFIQNVSLCIDTECSEADKMHAESICSPVMSSMPNMSVTMTSSSSVVVHISTTIHASGYNSTTTMMGTGNSTKVITTAATITGNLTKTSNTHPSTTDDSTTDTSETESSSTTDASSSGDASETSGTAAAASSTGGAARVVGSGFLAAVMGMGFFFL